jgi:exodeoxyribonuclease V gamma subunit
MLVHGNRPEALRDLLVTWVRRHPLAPLETEVILAQSNGIAQWLKLALAADPVREDGKSSRDMNAVDLIRDEDKPDSDMHLANPLRDGGTSEGDRHLDKGEDESEASLEGGLGIAAALEISLPSRFLWRVYRAVLGGEAVPETSPFDKSRLVWRLMRLLPEVMTRPEYQPLARFLAADTDRRKRFQLAERLADLFDQYQVYRADWLAAWAAGEDVLIDARGKRGPLPTEQRWQASLWRVLLADLAGGRQPGGMQERHAALGTLTAQTSSPQPSPARGDGARESAGYATQARPGDRGCERLLGSDPSSPGAGAGAGAGELIYAGRAAVHEAFLARAAAWPTGERPPGLPRRLLVFGISSLPRQSLEVLAALARWTQVLMCVHNPCEHYWADILADQDLLRAEHRRQRRRIGMPDKLAAEDLHQHAHPLLAAWGKQGRDFIGLLDEHDDEGARGLYAARFHAIGERIDLFDPPRDPTQATTLLAQLQDDIRDLRPLAESRDRWPPVDPARDFSLRFHIAHGPQREVEILHDQLLAAFNADPSLTPRDVIVMVPDIDAYAPHIQAVFGLVDRQDPRYIPFSLADQGRRATDPLVQALASLLELPQSRLAVSDLLDLLEVPALQRRCGISVEDLPRLHRWVRGANIRWGLHAAQRASLELPDQPEDQARHTWRFGLRRMLLGYAVGQEAAAWRGIEPFDEIGGLDAALLGPLTRLLDRLDATWRTLREPATVAAWCARLRQLLADFLDAGDSSEDAFTLLQLETALQDWLEAGEEAGLTEKLPLSIVGEHWLSRLDEGGLSQRFFAGAVTFATLMPMRAIPFRLVCLLGMNDGDYPRQRPPLDFDLMGQDYRPGDRSRREDDRYLFLEALLSARERLYLSWVGRRITDNSPRPPSVLVGQLRDHLAAGWRLADSKAIPQGLVPPSVQGLAPDNHQGPAQTSTSLLDALTQEHPLQPFSLRYFPSDPAVSPWFTYAREWRPGVAVSEPPGRVGQAPLPPLCREEPFRLRDLADFLKAPVKAFFTQRLGVYFDVADPAAEDQEPFSLDHLQRWLLNDELIQAQARAVDAGEPLAAVRAASLERIRRRGDLAPGGFGEALAEELDAPMDKLFAEYREALGRWPQSLADEMEILVPAQTEDQSGDQPGTQTLAIADWLGGLRADAAGQRGRVVLETSDLVKDRHYRGEKVIRHWVAHLAGNLGEEPLTTLVLSKVGKVELAPLPPDQARRHLAELLRAWDEGLRRPLPLATRTAFAWLKGGDPGAARQTYEGGYNQQGEVETDPYLARVYPDYAALTADGAFNRLAETLFGPLLAALPAAASKPSVADQAGEGRGASGGGVGCSDEVVKPPGMDSRRLSPEATQAGVAEN